jgi:hypothetical protein
MIIYHVGLSKKIKISNTYQNIDLAFQSPTLQNPTCKQQSLEVLDGGWCHGDQHNREVKEDEENNWSKNIDKHVYAIVIYKNNFLHNGSPHPYFFYLNCYER